MSKFKVGDKVYLLRSSIFHAQAEPNEIGKIIDTGEEFGNYEFKIKWTKGLIACYNSEDITLAIPSINEVKLKAKLGL